MASDLWKVKRERWFEILLSTFSKSDGEGGGQVLFSSWSSIIDGKGERDSFGGLRVLF